MHCSATVDADVGCVCNGGGVGGAHAEASHSVFVENGVISGGVSGSCGDVIGSKGVV